MLDLSGRVAIITGAAGLLGRQHCETLAAVGANLVLADLDAQSAEGLVERIIREHEIEALNLKIDVSDPSSVKKMVAQTMDTWGRVDILVNNAAIDPKFDSAHEGKHANRFEEFPLSAWQQALDVNVTGMFLCAQAAVKPMLEAKRGVIVNVASIYGLVGPDQRLYQREGEPAQYKPVTYTVSKAAVLGLTRYLATYLARTGIRVNTLTPGGVFAGHDDVFVERYSSKTTLGRMAKAEEISNALLFLVSDASSYMTGTNLVVDGGWTAW